MTTPDPLHHAAAPPEVTVIGGGIAGFAAALTAAAGGRRVLVLEAHGLGGRARTAHRDGFDLNIGPHAVYLHGALRRVLGEHGIDPAGGAPSTAAVGLVRDGVRHVLRLNPVSLARTPVLRPRERARLAAFFVHLARTDPESLVGRTVTEWLADEPDGVRQVAQAFVRVSSYTHAPDTFDAGAAAAAVKLGRRGVRYVDGGWERIVDAMARRAQQLGVEVRTGVHVEHVAADGPHVEVVTATGSVRTSAVVIAAGGPEVAERLTGLTVGGRDALTEPVRAATLDLATARPFPGCFSLGLDRPLYLSPHAPAAALAPAGRGLVTAMRYLAPGEAAPPVDAAREELRALARCAGIAAGDVLFERFLHDNVVVHGAPTASGGGLRGRPGVGALGVPGVLLAGDWVGAEGLLADAAAASGAAAGRAAVGAVAGPASASPRASMVP